MSKEHPTFERPTPTCPHCGYQMDSDDMLSTQKGIDVFAMAPNETTELLTCPSCDKEYWVQGGYYPTYTSAIAEELL
jgi:uncharacterized protein with PIN domain